MVNWRVGSVWGEVARLDNVFSSWELGRFGGIVIELVEVRIFLNEVKKGRGSGGFIYCL